MCPPGPSEGEAQASRILEAMYLGRSEATKPRPLSPTRRLQPLLLHALNTTQDGAGRALPRPPGRGQIGGGLRSFAYGFAPQPADLTPSPDLDRFKSAGPGHLSPTGRQPRNNLSATFSYKHAADGLLRDR